MLDDVNVVVPLFATVDVKLFVVFNELITPPTYKFFAIPTPPLVIILPDDDDVDSVVFATVKIPLDEIFAEVDEPTYNAPLTPTPPET